MDENKLKEIIKRLNDKSYQFSLDGHISSGNYNLRGIFIYNETESKNLKNLIDGLGLKGLKVKENLVWYLGDRKKVLCIRLKKEAEFPIQKWELMQTNNYGTK
jgi:hypothetical protein